MADAIEAIRRDVALYLQALHGLDVAGPAANDEPVPDGTSDAPPETTSSGLVAELEGAARCSRLTTVARAFGLGTCEQYILLMCAACEFSPEVAEMFGMVRGDRARGFASLDLIAHIGGGSRYDYDAALLPSAPLRRWELVRMVDDGTFATCSIRIDEWLYHTLFGRDHIDSRLRPYVREPRIAAEPVPSHREIADRIAHRLLTKAGGTAGSAVGVFGATQADRADTAGTIARRIGSRLYALRAQDLPGVPSERAHLATLLGREALLGECLVLLECDGIDPNVGIKPLIPFVEDLTAPLLVSSGEPLALDSVGMVRYELRAPSVEERRAVWQRELGVEPGALNGTLDRVLEHFAMGSSGIAGAAARLRQEHAGASDAAYANALWDACRTQARPKLDDLAKRIEPRATWDELVLPDTQMNTIREIAAHVRQRMTVYQQWGFARTSNRGLGISALFAGASGTGKTMAAEVLAGELRLDLYHIDLSQVVSKYIGETEKNLRRIFDAAEEGGAVLLFDEADALFGKRSEVKDSHDRHANIEVSYLLQRMESYSGLAILTTNMKSALDTAFMRRLRFVVDFPFPGNAQREQIWKRIYPAELPRAGLDTERLARLDVAGGNIRNIALNAAFLAADEGVAVQMRHILRATRSEYVKLEKQLTDMEISGWV